MPRRKKNRKGRPTLLSRLSVAQLKAELNRRRSMLNDLRKQRVALSAELASLDAEIAEIEPTGTTTPQAPRQGPGRPLATTRKGHGGKQSLPALIHSMLIGKTMSVAEIADAAKKAGHKSKSKNFRTIVSLTLLNRKLFKRVGWGQYTAK